jgi:uncharacterized protein (DUF2461 family)
MAPELSKARQEIDYNYAEWSKIVGGRRFLKYYSAGLDRGEILSRPPKGYDAENPAIEFLKLKSFTTTRSLTDAELSSRSLVKNVVGSFEAMKDFVGFLNRAIE